MISPTTCTTRFSAFVAAGALLILSNVASGQSLAIRDDYFTVDGIKRCAEALEYLV